MKFLNTSPLNPLRVGLVSLFAALVFTSCNSRESMDDLGYELVRELEKLPVSLQRIDTANGDESQAIEIAEMQMLSEALRDLSERSIEAKPMTRETQLAVSKRVRELQDEVEYRLLQMQDRPDLVLRCSREIELIAAQLHDIEQRMKAGE
jgi:hypothetical protein